VPIFGSLSKLNCRIYIVEYTEYKSSNFEHHFPKMADVVVEKKERKTEE
jgi:hypothetical protein